VIGESLRTGPRASVRGSVIDQFGELIRKLCLRNGKHPMKKTRDAPGSIDGYIAGFSPDVQKKLKQVRAAIRKAAPGATEMIQYGIPTFFLNENLVHFAAFGSHVGFYPTPSGIRKFKAALISYKSAKRVDAVSRRQTDALETDTRHHGVSSTRSPCQCDRKEEESAGRVRRAVCAVTRRKCHRVSHGCGNVLLRNSRRVTLAELTRSAFGFVQAPFIPDRTFLL
jgi:uncharacterized protein YdhG (YjbR/CyaY superfamily)